MQIPSLTTVVTHIQNPNLPLGTLIEEIPSDIGRSIQGYKRGGIIEGAEKFRKEAMAAAVWLGGIPLFKYLGDKLFERLYRVPMKVDFSNAEDGNDAVRDTLKYIFNNDNSKNLDVSELKPKYISKFRKMCPDNPKEILKAGEEEIAKMAKNISTGKKLTSAIAVVINCVLMGIVLPKINQKITKKKLLKQKQDSFVPKFEGMKEYSLKTKKKTNNHPSFTGFFQDLTNHGFTYALGYNTENNNRFRLISTDIPMIIGRTATSRNKYEGFENFFMDSGSIFFYNYCTPVVQKLLRNTIKHFDKGNKIPDIQPEISDYIASLDKETLEGAFASLNENTKDISEIFSEQIRDNILKKGTYGKYKKINRFYKNSDIVEINSSTVNYLNYLKTKTKDSSDIVESVKQLTSKVNKTNAVFLGAGLLMSIAGLSYILPKLTFFITKKMTGQDGFPGITEYKNENKKA